jgi:hypothetical protein
MAGYCGEAEGLLTRTRFLVASWLRERARRMRGCFGKTAQQFLGIIQQSGGRSRPVSAKFRKKVVLFINSLQEGNLSSHVFILLTEQLPKESSTEPSHSNIFLPHSYISLQPICLHSQPHHPLFSHPLPHYQACLHHLHPPHSIPILIICIISIVNFF